MKETKDKLSSMAIHLHWIVAVTIITLMSVGIYMSENEAFALYGVHKSVGVLIFLFIMIRVVWRLKQGWPEPVRQYEPMEQALSKVVHYVLLIGTVLMPISGFIMSAAGGYGVSVFGLELFAANPSPVNPGEMVPLNAGAAETGHVLHSLVGYVMLVAIFLHIAGALKHHLIDKDRTLHRMLGRETS